MDPDEVARRALARYERGGPLCRRYRRLDPRGRAWLRRVLFERWDETQERGPGLRIRAALLRLARRCHMRFPQAELRQMNRRRQSRAPFAP